MTEEEAKEKWLAVWTSTPVKRTTIETIRKIKPPEYKLSYFLDDLIQSAIANHELKGGKRA